MKKILAVVAVVAVFIGGFASWQATQGQGTITSDQAESMMLAAAESDAQRDLYATVAETFPDDYQGFLQDMADLVNAEGGTGQGSAQRGFTLAQNFTANLRADNAHYLANAPYENIAKLRAANTVVLKDLLDTPSICAQYAVNGGASFTMDQLEFLNLDLFAATGTEMFVAIAAGRDTPVEHAEATQADINATLLMWTQQPDVTPDIEASLMSGDPQNPLYCAANISFENFIATSSDPTVQTVTVYLSLLAAGIQID